MGRDEGKGFSFPFHCEALASLNILAHSPLLYGAGTGLDLIVAALNPPACLCPVRTRSEEIEPSSIVFYVVTSLPMWTMWTPIY